MKSLTPELASKFASLALGHVGREYPNKIEHVLNDAGDARVPRELHPLFYGNFDWHSCVHGHWLLARLYRQVHPLPEAERIRDLFDAQFTAAKISGEIAYFRAPGRGTFERPYGWGWLLMLAGELARMDSAEGRAWSKAVQPLASEIVQRFHDFLPRATYPIRVGTHFNSAFGMTLAFDYADAVDDESLAGLLREKAAGWYGDDVDCQAWEPGGDDFLSSALIEAECMRRAFPPEEFEHWFGHFLPRAASRQPVTLFTPAIVSDRTDGKIGHLDGLNLSRAWCWRSIAHTLPASNPLRPIALDAAAHHIDASLPHVAGDYAGEHWLATFALLALGGGLLEI